MINWTIEFFSTLSTNPVATGILASTIIGGLLYWCRELPKKLWFFCWNACTIQLDIVQENSWVSYRIFEEKLNSCKLYYISGSFMSVFKYFLKEVYTVPGEYGLFLAKVDGIWCIVQKYTDKQVSFWHSFCYSVRFFTRNTAKISQIFNRAYQEQQSLSTGPNIKVFHYVDPGCEQGGWDYCNKPKIPFETHLSKTKLDICKTVEFFLNNRETYLKRGRPYREGFILSGEPGTGKSYFIQQLASKFNLNIYYINISQFQNDMAFTKALMEINFPSILLFEDIDCCEIVENRKSSNDVKENVKAAVKRKNREKDDGVHLSTLLNSFDGLLAQEGQLVFLTTNHLDKLDPALIRAGRFNTNVVFEKLTGPEIIEIVNRFYEADLKLDLGDKRMTIAELTGLCNLKSLEEIKEILVSKE